MTNYSPIEGQTMVLSNNEDIGYSGDSLDYGGGQSGDWRVYWYWDPTTQLAGGITNINWPEDFDSFSGAAPIMTLLHQLQSGEITTETINQAVYNYAYYHLMHDDGDWTNFRNIYNANAVDCIRPAKG